MSYGVVSIYGLRAWKKELKYRSEFALTKKVLKATYGVRDGFDHVRKTRFSSYEFPAGFVLDPKKSDP